MNLRSFLLKTQKEDLVNLILAICKEYKSIEEQIKLIIKEVNEKRTAKAKRE